MAKDKQPSPICDPRPSDDNFDELEPPGSPNPHSVKPLPVPQTPSSVDVPLASSCRVVNVVH